MKDFALEFIKRFLRDTPQFFKIIRNISGVLAVLSLIIPVFVDLSGALPEQTQIILNKAVGYIAAAIAFVAQLTVVNPDNETIGKLK